MYNKTLDKICQLEQQGKIFVIRPSLPLEISRMSHDPEQLQYTYEIGIKDAKGKLEAMKQWLWG